MRRRWTKSNKYSVKVVFSREGGFPALDQPKGWFAQSFDLICTRVYSDHYLVFVYPGEDEHLVVFIRLLR